MSIVEKALSRLKLQKQPIAPFGAVQERPAAITPGVDATEPPRPHKVVAVDRLRLREEGFLAPENYQRQMADEYRRIKRPLIANAFGIGVPAVAAGNLILVTSAISSEGKTHTCINLALSMAAERDRTVLLVDGDIPKPHISRLFGVADQPGLMDVLQDQRCDPGELLIHTDIPNLSLLPAGRWHEHSTELLASGRMRSVCQELSQRYADRIVLFDSPPLLAATEGQVIGAAVGQVVLVIAENLTGRDDVQAALALLDDNKAINAVLNKSRLPVMAGGYHYGGYGYGAHAASDSQDSRRSD